MAKQFNSQSDRQPFADDPSTWPVSTARAVAVGLDFGFSQDHSALVVVAEYGWQGRSFHAVLEVTRLPLQTPPSEVRELAVQTVQRWTRPRGPAQLVADARSNMAFFEQLVRSGITPLPVGVSATSAETHAVEPRVVPIPAGGRRLPGLIYTVSRNQLIDSLNAQFEARAIAMTREGDAGFLRSELHGLVREVTAARNIRYVTPSGGHDDCLMALCYALWGLDRLPRPRAKAPEIAGRPQFSAEAWT